MRRGTRGPYYSHWCVLLEFHLKRKRLTGQAFARLVGRSQQVVHSYQTGKTKPPLELLREWTGKLAMTPMEREQFITAGYEAWTPGVVWAKLLELEAKAMASAEHVQDPGEVGQLRKTIEALLVVLREVEAIFYARSVPGGVEEIHRRRSEIGLAIREAIERHSRPPPRNGNA